MDLIKDYFDVTNEYVMHKLKIIVLPFLVNSEDWKRQQGGAGLGYDADNSAGLQESTPRNDIQAPDLYIPLMAYVTFILLVGLIKAFVKEEYTVE